MDGHRPGGHRRTAGINGVHPLCICCRWQSPPAAAAQLGREQFLNVLFPSDRMGLASSTIDSFENCPSKRTNSCDGSSAILRSPVPTKPGTIPPPYRPVCREVTGTYSKPWPIRMTPIMRSRTSMLTLFNGVFSNEYWASKTRVRINSTLWVVIGQWTTWSAAWIRVSSHSPWSWHPSRWNKSSTCVNKSFHATQVHLVQPKIFELVFVSACSEGLG